MCGYDKCVSALEFHHLGNKEESPAYIIMRWSWERVKAELEKCILVCANCHREIHYEDRDLDLKRFLKPWVEKNCPTCKSEFDTKNEEQIYCSHNCHKLSTRKAERPTVEELTSLLKEDSFVSVGKMYGVSDNAVRKWCKSYGLNPKDF